MTVHLLESPEYELVEDPSPRGVGKRKSACVAPQDKVVHVIKIRPLALGNVNLTVSAFTDTSGVSSCGVGRPVQRRYDHCLQLHPVVFIHVAMRAIIFSFSESGTSHIFEKGKGDGFSRRIVTIIFSFIFFSFSFYRDTLIKPIKVEAEGFLREKTFTKYVCANGKSNN